MRTLLVAAAAGALALGSVAGATAAPGRKSNDKPVLQVVNIVGHSPLNVFDVTTTDNTTMSVRPLTVRATVRYNGMTPLPTISVTLDAYSSKVRGTDLTKDTAITTVTLKPKITRSKVNTHYRATYQFSDTEAKAMKDCAGHVEEGLPVHLDRRRDGIRLPERVGLVHPDPDAYEHRQRQAGP